MGEVIVGSTLAALLSAFILRGIYYGERAWGERKKVKAFGKILARENALAERVVWGEEQSFSPALVISKGGESQGDRHRVWRQKFYDGVLASFMGKKSIGRSDREEAALQGVARKYIQLVEKGETPDKGFVEQCFEDMPTLRGLRPHDHI